MQLIQKLLGTFSSQSAFYIHILIQRTTAAAAKIKGGSARDSGPGASWGEAIYFYINSIWCSSTPHKEAVWIPGTWIIFKFQSFSWVLGGRGESCRKHGKGNHLELSAAVPKPRRASQADQGLQQRPPWGKVPALPIQCWFPHPGKQRRDQ